jgi:deoxyribodipyrimidine photo-lyase
MQQQPWGVHWFRRDLRLAANPALAWNAKKHDGRVLGIFCLDREFLARPDFSAHRFAFFLETLAELRQEIRKAGGDLLTLDIAPSVGFAALLDHCRKQRGAPPSMLSFNRDYEPFAVARDAKIRILIEGEHGIPVHTDRDHLVIEPSELYKGDERGTFYQVYTPFKKKWLSLFGSDEIQERVMFKKVPSLESSWTRVLGKDSPFRDALDDYRDKLGKQVSGPLPPAGERAALAQLKRFSASALPRYGADRDIPSLRGTSGLSVYLKNGSITTARAIAEIASAVGIAPALLHAKGGPDVAKFVEELVWREFYYHILAHVPRVEHTAFNLKYEGLPWENRPEHLAAWKDGRTGFPIVDAAMRQLNETGWMHNRMRMVVASFLTKDLLCDWKLGERYFMQKLLDGDLAPNNGGWQWAASTGCDPQPYFRIFNPVLQSRRFDPQGEYIRRWVPELRDCSDRDIHDPHARGTGPVGYPRPIVEHGVQSKRAVAMYRGPKRG